ncbi:nucleolar protein 12-domain-containing protein [Phellopilus nigrolimitatus]|nr:nucleolar protein 12-domain-containing protein [Phellopilus nigrolimitatus]
MASNVDILTRSHTILKAKARAKKNQIDQIVFDEDARREYLTGFRKRNIQKKEAAQTKAKERERQERLQARREQRQARQEQARENAQLVESAFRKDIDDGNSSEDDEFMGFSSPDKGKGKATQEYEDEEQLATVTVVEEFDPDTLRYMPSTSRNSPEPPQFESESFPRARTTSDSTGSRRKGKPVLKKKIAYETKAVRKATRQKQRVRKVEKAEFSGGRSKRVQRKETARGGKKGRKPNK